MVDGHSAHGADNRRVANTDSNAALRRRYGHPVVSDPDSRSRSNATKWAGHSSAAGRPGTTPGKPVLQPLEREAARGVPYDQLAVHRGRVRKLHGPGHDLRKRRPHLGASPGAQHHLAGVDGDESTEAIVLQTLPCLMSHGPLDMDWGTCEGLGFAAQQRRRGGHPFVEFATGAFATAASASGRREANSLP